MNAEQYLNSYRDMLEAVQDMDNQIRKAELRLQKLTQRYDAGSGGGGTTERQQAQLAALGDLSRRRDELREKACRRGKELEKFIKTVGGQNGTGQRIRDLLQMYYVELFTWAEVQECLGTVRSAKNGRTKNRDTHTRVSDTTLWRIRQDALVAAERAWRKQGN